MKTTKILLLILLSLSLVFVSACGAGEGNKEATQDEQVSHDQGPGEGHGAAPAATDGNWCAEHEIDESECPFCSPGLIDSLGWCGGHNVPEALCYQCNGNLVAAFKAVGDWCGGHDRPESQCYICNPHLEPKDGADEEPEVDDSLPRIQRPPSVTCLTQNLVINFDREEIAAEIGLEFSSVQRVPLTRFLDCNATITYNANRYARIASQVGGVVSSLEKDLGEKVEPGEVLAIINSMAFGAAKATFLQADAAASLWEKNYAREKDLLDRGVGTEQDLLEAETRLMEGRIALSRAREKLLGLGLSDEQVDEVRHTMDTSNLYPVTASFAAVVVERQAGVGEVFDTSQPLFTIADISHMWAILDIYEADAREVSEGQSVVLQLEGQPGESFGGDITWISSQLDPRTRTLQARAVLDNSRGVLRANMFAKSRVTVRNHQPVLIIPREAVQWEGCCNVVFVKKSETSYHPRKVTLGPANDGIYEVISGLSEGETVVTQGSFLLKTEILKNNIGAGCCEVQPGQAER
ncbi:MAG: efflux RND transporter periplasmic adaptor subunit [bacterium]|nr:efflux RND transporter periplasmic adaptor subunit [bacterium]